MAKKATKARKGPVYSIEMQPDLRTALDKAAADDGGRSTASLVTKILTDAMRAQGYLKK